MISLSLFAFAPDEFLIITECMQQFSNIETLDKRFTEQPRASVGSKDSSYFSLRYRVDSMIDKRLGDLALLLSGVEPSALTQNSWRDGAAIALVNDDQVFLLVSDQHAVDALFTTGIAIF